MAYIASKSDKLYKMAVDGIKDLFDRIMDEHNKLVKDNGSSQVLNCEPQEDNNRIQQLHQPLVENPNISQTKGRPPKDDKGKGKVSSTGRLLAGIESSTANKKRKCSVCQDTTHDKRIYPKKADMEQLKISEPSTNSSNEDTISLEIQ
ncbi:uncharacterized protein LOC113330438 [Papaver somniferum]|uniref:uncharacterized protein LOC113330438 n=1 Tax=Papaver somniferum TaxID=3469 RepID=UPI000E7018A5|nr:uncharacterized protein LOC113330438 [Papaver somniferum]